jgi:DNA modification methylase
MKDMLDGGSMPTKAAATGQVTPAAAKRTEVNITPAKGRPMLVWVGKRALSHVTPLPAQHVEVFDPTGQFSSGPRVPDQWTDWPVACPKGGLLFLGDNKDVLAHLLAYGFRGKVKLVYIDPPFDSGADYVRKVSLRGASGTAKINGEGYTLGEQIQYTDIWANDNYLQFMYERLLLLKELMAGDSMIYLHADGKRNYQLRFIMDEVFGQDCFRNEIVWWYWNKMQGNVNRFASNHDTIICYRKGSPKFRKIREERESMVRQLKRVWNPKSNSLVNAKDEEGNLIYIESEERTVDDVWRVSMLQPSDESENLRFPTQKPEELLDIIVASSSNPGDIVLDCFIGSGTLAAVAQNPGRRWIGCDINKGAIQLTAKRLQKIIREQVKPGGARPENEPSGPAQLAFTVWRVNDYELAIQHNEAVNLACEYIGIQRARTDGYFDGTLGRSLVKVIPFGHPLTPLDLEELRRELEARPEEDRSITIVCLDMELSAKAWIEDWNRLRRGNEAVNRMDVIELRTDPRYGRFIKHEPACGKIKAAREEGKLVVEIEDFISPTILDRLSQQAGLVAPRIDDWRAMVDCVMIDPAYNGQVFHVALSDVPERKSDLVAGRYELQAPAGDTTVAVKIIDMLGEEVLISQALKR